MVDFNGKTLLVIAPHPDDEVIGCTGLIRHIKKNGGRVHVLFLTVAETQDFSHRGASTAAERLREIEAVANYFDFDGWQVAFPGEQFHLNLDQTSQRQIINAIERGQDISLEALRPDVIAFPMFGDYNQDHRAAAEAAFAACRPAAAAEKHIPSIALSYEAPMSAWAHPAASFVPNLYLEMSEEDAVAKMQGMNLYASQVRAPGHPRHSETLKALAQVRGSEIGTRYAEAFLLHRLQVHQYALPSVAAEVSISKPRVRPPR